MPKKVIIAVHFMLILRLAQFTPNGARSGSPIGQRTIAGPHRCSEKNCRQ